MGRTVRVRNVGVELEGAWRVSRGVSLYGDGSVSVTGSRTMSGVANIHEYRHGETAIPAPGLPLMKALAWVRKNYPDFGNETCGIHVHMSMRHLLHYAHLVDDIAYCNTLYERLRDVGHEVGLGGNHRLFYRLMGHNSYCRLPAVDTFPIQMAAPDHSDERYRGVNFCYGHHGTVEVRVLPYFESVDVAVRMIYEVVATTDKFLGAFARSRERRLVERIAFDTLPEGDVLTERREFNIECA